MSSCISPAIIMRVKEFGESDLLVTFFAFDRGRLKGVAKGARRSRRRFANCLDLFCLTDLEYNFKAKGDLCFIHSGKLISPFQALRSDFSSLSLASYMTELTEILFPLGVVDKSAFELLKDSFFALEEDKRKDVLRIFFEARAMALGGYGINLERCCSCGRQYTGTGNAVFKPNKGGIACLKCEHESALCPCLSPDTAKILKHIQSGLWHKFQVLSLTEQAIREIKPVLKLHIEYRIGRRLKSARYME
ncbi:MAG: DNA repair protein RecO [Thermodesulfobacteriota bacterium]|nr:DNA repair protein RecO [Thermodesulfobacteriota bacterium]